MKKQLKKLFKSFNDKNILLKNKSNNKVGKITGQP